jgi:hypothetical protein
MIKALTAVENGMKIRHASELYGVPKSTLHDRVTGKVQHGTRPGPSAYLTEEEEEELVEFLLRCAEIGYPHTISQILGIVQQLVNYKGISKKVTQGWWQKFAQRHKEVTLRSAVPLSMIRAKAMDIDSINRYFDVLEHTLKENGIYNKPTLIYNCDESGIPLNPKGLKVVAKTGAKNISAISGNSKGQITVLACTSASGVALPPMVIFDRKTLNPELTTGEVPGTIYGLSDKGWINRELFLGWFYKHFLLLIPKTRPVLLLLDGHSSHYCPEVIRAAAKEKVILFTLPPHTTHITQPLDRGCFSPLKSYWKQLCHEFYAKNPGRVITRFDFSSLFSEAWRLAMSQKNIISGFKITGVYPFDRKVVQEELHVSKATSMHTLSEETGIAYIPLYTPRKVHCGSEKWEADFETMDVEPDSEGEMIDTFSRRLSVSEGDLTTIDYTQVTQPGLRIRRATSVTQFLNTPPRPRKEFPPNKQEFTNVLTSEENMAKMEEKERKKEEKKIEKERKKAVREAKAELKKSAKLQQKTDKKKRKQNTDYDTDVSSSYAPLQSLEISDDFSEEEIKLFTKRYQNNYDLKHDERYNLWIKLFHNSRSGSPLSVDSGDETTVVPDSRRGGSLTRRAKQGRGRGRGVYLSLSICTYCC